MSGGEVLRRLLEEQKSYHMQALNKPRAATESFAMASSRENSPMVKPKVYKNKNGFLPPRRAMSDESPMAESPCLSSKASGKSNSIDAPRKSCNKPTNFSPDTPSNESAGLSNICRSTKLGTDERFKAVGIFSDDMTNCYQGKTTLYNSPSNRYKSSIHPKSSSAGEDSCHCDRKSKLQDGKLGKRRGKYATSITRSRSLHSAENSSSLRASTKTDVDGIKRDLNEKLSESNNSTPRKQDLLQVFTNEPSQPTDLPHSEEAGGSLKESEPQSYEQQRLVRFQNNMVVLPGMGGVSQPPVQQSNPHGPYYAMLPQNSIAHHHLPQRHVATPSKQHPITQQSPSVPRGPPPPYPKNSANNDDSHPQRPNSLSLSGQVSRKKMEYGGAHVNVAGLTSPAIPTTTHLNSFHFPLSAGTPPHEILFLSLQEDTKTNEANQDSHNTFGLISPIRETSFMRSGAGQGFQSAASSSSQPPNSTDHLVMNTSNATTSTTSMKQHPRQEQTRGYSNNLNSNPTKQVSLPLSNYQLQSYGEFHNSQQPTSVISTQNGYSLGKSDSNASTCSGGSRIARRTKRNSKNFSNVSGSSSSTGNSRPNSSADYLERILNENEALKNQLVTADMKLKKYQNVEKELSRVTEDYHNFRLSVNKSENIRSTLISQLETSTNRTQQENEILRQRINTLTEFVETIQTSNKDDKTSSADISSLKIKVQELQARERQLNEQYEEALEKISEQSEDITLLSTSLERMQTNVASLKAELLEKQKLDRYAENLSPFLDALTKTIQSREQAERELNEITVAEQRQSISSNDEGISEMDPNDYLSRAAPMSTGTRKQFVRAHAQMLKWQHTYLQTAILRELSTFTSGATPSPLYSVLRKHRHAISEPSYSDSRCFDQPLSNSDGRSSADTERRNRMHYKRYGGHGPNEASDKTNSERNRTPFRHGKPSNTTEESAHLKAAACDVDNESLDYSKIHPSAAIVKVSLNNTERTASNEADSPSEGYHSQQSSGSPTPSSERSLLHFSEESQVSNSAHSPHCGGCPSLCTVGSGKTVLTKGVDV